MASCSCTLCSASAIAAPTRTTSTGGSAPPESTSSTLMPSTHSVTRYGVRARSPAATKRGTCAPRSAGTMVASVSKPMIPSLGSRRGTFMISAALSPSFVTE